MKKIVVLFSFLFALSACMWAQDYPKAEIFGGYQFLHLGNGADVNANGWNAALTGNVNKWLGVTGDFSGAYKTISGVSTSVYSYTGGPTVSLNREGVVNPFVHALFGGVHLGASAAGAGSASTNGFTMMFGGGVDAKVAPAFAVRVAQVDWVYYRISGTSESKNVRLSTGIVLRF